MAVTLALITCHRTVAHRVVEPLRAGHERPLTTDRMRVAVRTRPAVSDHADDERPVVCRSSTWWITTMAPLARVISGAPIHTLAPRQP